MAKDKTELVRLPDSELEIMQILWGSQEALSRPEIEEYLAAEGMEWDTSTVNSLLGRLKNRGFLASEKNGKKYYYHALVTEEEYLQVESKKLLSKLFRGKTVNFLAALVEGDQISEEEFSELEEFLRQRKERL